MNKIVKPFVIFAGLVCSLYSCEFSPSEIPLTEIEEPSDAPGIWINLKPGMDTLKLSESTIVNYSVETGEYQLYRIELQLDGVEIPNLSYTSQSSVNAFINVSVMADGLHELKIRTYTSTNSGSIADKIGSEVFWYELSWPVVIDIHAKENFSVNSVQPTLEGLKLSWSLYDFADFESYELNRYSLITGKNTSFNTTVPYLNSFVDGTYVEGDYFSYSLYLYASGVHFFHFEYHEDIIAPKVKVNSDCTVDIDWSRSKYEKNVQGYYIRTAVPGYGSMEEHDLTNLSQTKFSLDKKIGFGGDYEVQLRYIPKGFEGYHTFQVAGGLTKFALGDSIPASQRVFSLPQENALLIFNNGSFMKYSLTDKSSTANFVANQVENVYLWTVTCSPGGVLFGYFDGHDYVIRRTSDWSLVRKMDIKAYDGFNLTLLNISLSDTGILSTTDYNSLLRIFDVYSGNQLLEKIFSGFLPKATLSPDGKHICMLNNNYSTGIEFLYFDITGNQLKEVNRLDGAGDGSFVQFSPLGDHKMVIVRHTGMYDFIVEERDENSFELIYSVDIAHSFFPIAYDFYSHKAVVQYQFFPTRDYSYLYDLQTGEQKKIVQFCSQNQVVFVDSRAYSTNGRSIRIDDYIME